MDELVSLHKHWLNADSLAKVVDMKIGNTDELPEELAEFAEMFSSFARLSVLYGLVYVVIEGYKELGCSHDKVDELLAKEDFVDALRLFRNSTFHYQKKAVPDKLMKFLNLAESEVWIRKLHHSFKIFFEDSLPIEETIESLKA